jgi:tRNA threonylcarbamoyladenosine biosynthesis protein TsaE
MKQDIINDLQQLTAFAAQIAASGKRIILLEGELGAGKTEFSRAYINSFSAQPITVTSPTYNIVQIYEVKPQKIYHFDLYRLESDEELSEIGFDEALEEAICLIEWPEIAENALKRYKNEIIKLKIEILNEKSRRITTN